MRTKEIIIAAKIISILLVFLHSSCKRDDHGISAIPVIEFEDFTQEKDIQGNDSIIHISIRYTDGDGDIGLSDSDTLPPFDLNSPYNHNLPIKIFYKKGGPFKELLDQSTNEPVIFHERIPILTPEGKNKTITGTLTIHLPANPLNLEPEEMRFEINLIDRALHISNTVSSPIVTLKH